MTATRDPDRLLRAWLDLMPDEAPDRVVSAVLQATHGASQVRALPWGGIRRTTRMNRLILIAATALVAVALAGGAILFTGGTDGPLGPTPTPVAPTPSSQASREVAAPAAEVTWGDWIADVEAIPDIQQPAGMLQLSIDWEDGLTIWIQQDVLDRRWVVESTSYSAAANELRVRAMPSIGCMAGEEGRYRWNRSSDGLFLTLELIEDACATRATAFARTWVRSHGALNDGGPGVNYALTPMVQSVLPARQWGMGQGTLQTFDETVPKIFLIFHQEPRGFSDPCASPLAAPVAIDQSLAGLVAYLRGLPGLTVEETDVEIGGLPGVHLGIASDSGTACASGGITALRNGGATDDTDDIGLVPGDSISLWAVDVGDHLLAFQYMADGFTLADEEAYISTITFIDQLPTP